MKNKNDKDERVSADQLRGKDAEQWMEVLWDELLTKVSNMKSKKELKRTLESLMSEHEKRTILRRLAVNALVRLGKSYKKIGEIIWVSPQTISAIRKNSFDMTVAYKSYRASPRKSKYGGSIRIEQGGSFLDIFKGVDLWELLTNPPRPTGTGLKSSIRNSSDFKESK
ncbi:MAG: Trp family transcriptional regulator [Patescibacteria group bacterium]